VSLLVSCPCYLGCRRPFFFLALFPHKQPHSHFVAIVSTRSSKAAENREWKRWLPPLIRAYVSTHVSKCCHNKRLIADGKLASHFWNRLTKVSDNTTAHSAFAQLLLALDFSGSEAGGSAVVGIRPTAAFVSKIGASFRMHRS